MARNTSKKSGNSVKYSQEQVNKALSAMDEGLSSRKAATTFNVPRSTLYAKQQMLIPVEASRGRSTYLTREEEEHLVQWIMYCTDRGFPMTKETLLQNVQNLVIALGRTTPFKNGKPGRHWWESFCKRHPVISLRVAQNWGNNRAVVNEVKLRSWFDKVKCSLLSSRLFLGMDPQRILNLDESAFFLVPKTDKVLARRGSKLVYKVVFGNEKESITVLFTVNAAGKLLPPLVLFWYKRVPENITKSLPCGWILGNSGNGWMDEVSFYKYVSEYLHPWLLKNEIQLPVILYVDGHSSHTTPKTIQFCKDNGIELIALHPNATHLIQPLDKGFFHPLKLKWKIAVDEWRCAHPGENLGKAEFAPTLYKAIGKMDNREKIIRNSFKACGLYPFSADAVDYTTFTEDGENQLASECVPVEQESTEKRIHDETFLEQFEKRLDSNDLHEFKNAVTSKSFQISKSANEGLFKYWLELQGLENEFVKGNVQVYETINLNNEMSPVIVDNFCIENNSLSTIIEIDETIHSLELENLVETSNGIVEPLVTDAANLSLKITDPFEEERDHLISSQRLQELPLDHEQDSNQCASSSKPVCSTPISSTSDSNKENESPQGYCSTMRGLKNSTPPAFDALFWPPEDGPKKGKKRKNKEIKQFNPMLCSDEWEKHHQEQADKKRKAQEEIECRKRKRIEAKQMKIEEKIKRREERERVAAENRRINAEIKKLASQKVVKKKTRLTEIKIEPQDS